MTNELIFFAIALIDLVFVLIASRLGMRWLFVSIVLNLLMISIFGGKLVSRFGFVSNSGNVFYACVFFATQLIVEYYGKKEAEKSILLGATAVIFFVIMSQLVVLTIGTPETRIVSIAMDTLFKAVPRVVAASIVAYLVSQTVNINLFSYLSNKWKKKMLFLRVNLTNIVGQSVDSVIFFAIAFYGVIPNTNLVQAIFAGYVIKIAVGFFSSIFFQLSGPPPVLRED